jgi:folate-binding protein YgfZ
MIGMTETPTADLPRLAHLRSRALVGVKGPDWRSFLQGLVTQDVETLAPGEWRYAALLTPQGRLLYDFFLIGEEDGALIDVASAQRHDLAQRLSLYRLRAKVEIGPAEGGVYALWDAASADPPWAPDPRLPVLGFRAIGLEAPAAPGAANEDEADYEARRLALGVTDAAKDGLHDRSYPIEANLDLLNGIDFRKGCFVGQETTSRMKRRGQVKTRMLPIAYAGSALPAGAEVVAGSLRAGEVVAAAEGRALALLKLDRIAGAALSAEGRPVAVETPAWAADALNPAGDALS